MYTEYQRLPESKSSQQAQPHGCMQCGKLITSKRSLCQQCLKLVAKENQPLPSVAKLFIGINFVIGAVLILIA
jgi:uncharacterized membrane protein YvbJ